MCGIAGWFNVDCRLPNNKSDLAAMLHAIKHRGPDEAGGFISDRTVMGSVRLSIIDLQGGSQPMSNESGTIWIVYNGEVYNYQELMASLIKKGHRFKTSCDTEVLIHLYEEYGIEAPQYVNGNFSFAIYDHKKEKIVMGRDRFGIRPLFYTFCKGRFYFASEVKSIFMIHEVPREFDPVGLNQIITLWAAIPPRTPFRAISQVPAGCTLTLDQKGETLSRYWHYPSSGNTKMIEKKDEAMKVIRYELKAAVKRRLVSDVPVGLYLSGGLDSSIVGALVREQYQGQLKSFSIRFEDKQFDESRYQDLIQRALGTEHHSLVIRNRDIADIIPDITLHAETPLFRTAPAPMFLLSNLVRDHRIKVVLTGEGADEAFYGYDIFREAKIRFFWGKYPYSKQRPLLLKKIYGYLPNFSGNNYRFQVAFFSKYLKETHMDTFSHQIRWQNNKSLIPFLSKEWQIEKNSENYLTEQFPPGLAGWKALEKARYIECKSLMEGYLLSSQGDRMALGNSVEGRFPFLDHQLWEAISGIHLSLFLNGVKEKWVLKESFKRNLPTEITGRSKQPYLAPNILAFFNQSRLPEYVRKAFDRENIKRSGYFQHEKVSALFDKVSADAKKASYREDTAFIFILTTMLLDDLMLNRNGLKRDDQYPMNWVSI